MQHKPKKRLGQNFLVDQNIQRKIVASCQLGPSDIVLEIGAGRGELTQAIAKEVKKVYAVEVDVFLCDILEENLEKHPNVEIIRKDMLKVNLKNILKKSAKKIKVVGNIPYYITSPIIDHLLKFKDKIEVIYLSVQKEFARRMVAQAGSKDFGSFSCFVQYYTCPKIIFSISKTCFWPAPKVDSSFLRLDINKNLSLGLRKEKLLFQVIRKAFNQRRKILKNSLKGLISSERLVDFFKKYKINPHIRPEDLTLQDFTNLINPQKI